MNTMKDKTMLGNTGNVLHKSFIDYFFNDLSLQRWGSSPGLFRVMNEPVPTQPLPDILQKGYQ
jgi:hypothetical protein